MGCSALPENMDNSGRTVPLLAGFLQPHLYFIRHDAERRHPVCICDDIMQCILSFATYTVTDLLSYALVNQQMRRILLQMLDVNPDPRLFVQALQNPHVAQQFIQMSQFDVVSTDNWASLYDTLFASCASPQHGESIVELEMNDVLPPIPQMDISKVSCSTEPRQEPCLHCAECMTPLLLNKDVLSSNYRIATGRAFLCVAVRNVNVSEDISSATYTTGAYEVSEVECAVCHTALGVKYHSSFDPTNNYKVGKFLLGQLQVIMPQCCKGLLPSFPRGACGKCKWLCRLHSLCVVFHMTKQLNPTYCRRLINAIQGSEGIPTACTGTLSEGEPPAKSRRLLRQCCRPLLPVTLALRRSPVSIWSESLLKRIKLPYIGHLTHHDRQMMSAGLVMFSKAFVEAAQLQATCLGFGVTNLTRSQVLGKMVPGLLSPQQSGEWVETARLISVAQHGLWEDFTRAELGNLISTLEPNTANRGRGLEAVLWQGETGQVPFASSHLRRSFLAFKGYLKNILPRPVLQLHPMNTV